jgi:hypothetical protein
MSVTVASFRAAFIAFSDATKFPDPAIQMWLDAAVLMVNASRWATLTDLGVQLYAAHNIVLESQADRAASKGRVPGLQAGILTSKGVGGVSAGYDVSSVTEDKAGHWNLTTYGTRFYRLSKLMGAGPMYVGAPSISDNTAMIWSGPFGS